LANNFAPANRVTSPQLTQKPAQQSLAKDGETENDAPCHSAERFKKINSNGASASATTIPATTTRIA
jgi:hypothetical protein